MGVDNADHHGNHPSERRRVIVSAAAGTVTAAGAAALVPWQLATLLGWDVAAITLLVWVWSSVGRMDAAETRRLATREDDSRAAARATVVAAGIVSIGGVFLGILKAREVGGAFGAVIMIAAVVAIALAWATTHTTFALRYAHRFYDAGGGIDFPGDADPTYLDFAYLAFTVGMTFQVADTDLTSRAMRGTLLQHAALAYLFGTVIVGITINVVAGLLG